MQKKPLEPRPPINIKLLAARYVITVVSFATLYSTISYGLILLKIPTFTASIIGVAAGVYGIFALMRRIGPWLDKKLEKKPDGNNGLK